MAVFANGYIISLMICSKNLFLAILSPLFIFYEIKTGIVLGGKIQDTEIDHQQAKV